MRITFLGTGTSQGVPIIGCQCEVCISNFEKDKRLRTSIMINDNETNVVIDTGPDFRQQMLREKVTNLDAVVFTHEHKDHIAGLDDIRPFNFLLKKKIDVFASHRVQEALKREYAYIFDEVKYPGIPEINLHNIVDKAFMVNDIEFLPILVYHHKLPVFGFRIKNFCYITDANFIPEKEKEKIKGCEVLVLNALRNEKHISHFTLDEAIELVNELKPEKAYFTHISHQLGLHENVQKKLPKNIFLAYDGLQLEM